MCTIKENNQGGIHLKYAQLPLGPLQTNCYLLIKENKDCLIIDPGGEATKLIKIMDDEKLNPKAILLTHAHFDHIGAVDDVKERYQIPVYIHENEKDWLIDPALNGSARFQMGTAIRLQPADELFVKEQELDISGFSFKVLETPGHSPGSVSFYFADIALLFGGDALFQGSIGRTDLPGGHHETLLQSIHDKLLILPEDTLVLPGHGPVTTIANEMDTNPFLNGFS